MRHCELRHLRIPIFVIQGKVRPSEKSIEGVRLRSHVLYSQIDTIVNTNIRQDKYANSLNIIFNIDSVRNFITVYVPNILMLAFHRSVRI